MPIFLLLMPIICAFEKEVNGRLDAVTTATLSVYRILKIEFKFVLFQMSKTSCVRSLIRRGVCNLTILLCPKQLNHKSSNRLFHSLITHRKKNIEEIIFNSNTFYVIGVSSDMQSSDS